MILYQFNGYGHSLIEFWILMPTAVLWIACAPIVFSTRNIPKFVAFLSSISFEIYLIHHPLCLGTFSLRNYFPLWISIPMVFILSILGGWILSRASSLASSLVVNDGKKIG